MLDDMASSLHSIFGRFENKKKVSILFSAPRLIAWFRSGTSAGIVIDEIAFLATSRPGACRGWRRGARRGSGRGAGRGAECREKTKSGERRTWERHAEEPNAREAHARESRVGEVSLIGGARSETLRWGTSRWEA